MTIRPFLNGAVFNPDELASLSMAFGDVCKALSLPDADKRGREVVAAKLIELAKHGERNADRLRDQALREVLEAGRERGG